jgi:GntR family transcriptional regulator/MocR family aminotransferase
MASNRRTAMRPQDPDRLYMPIELLSRSGEMTGGIFSGQPASFCIAKCKFWPALGTVAVFPGKLVATTVRRPIEELLPSRSPFPFDLLAVERGAAEPLHRQLYAALRDLIADGRLAAGSGLPATRTLAEQLGVGRNTVIAAYEQLLAEGYLEARRGSGTRVAPLPRPAPRAGRPEPAPGRLSRRGRLIASLPQPASHPGAVNLQPGYPEASLFPTASWARLLARNAQKRSADLLRYQHFAGHPRLRQAIARYVAVARGVACSPQRVIVVTGAQAALDLVARILLDDGDVAWMEEPGYLGARSALLGGGARLAPLRVGRQGWSLGAGLPPPRLIYLTPACQWPTGATMRIEERLQLLAAAERHRAWIVEDDYDGEYRFRGRPVPAIQGLDGGRRVIYVGSFGKTLFTSLRIGFLVVPEALADAFDRAVSVTGQFAPLLLQATLADFIDQGHFAAHLKRMRRLYARRQERFLALCRAELSDWLTVAENEAGMQLLARFARPLDDAAVAAAALARGIDVQPVSINYHHDRPVPGLLLGYAGIEERQMPAAMHGLRAACAAVAAAARPARSGSV